jgi:hypothetical protein
MRPGNGAGNGCFPRADAGVICAARRACSRAGCGDQQTGDLPHLSPFVVATPRWPVASYRLSTLLINNQRTTRNSGRYAVLPPYRQRYWFAKSSTERVMLGTFVK